MNDKEPSPVPDLHEVQAHVRHTPEDMRPGNTPDKPPTPPGVPESGGEAPPLSEKARAFLRTAASGEFTNLTLTQRWKMHGVLSGSERRKYQEELIQRGFIRLVRDGKRKTVHVYPAGYKYLGLDPPKGRGRGGADHQLYVSRLKAMLSKAGFDTYVEFEAGPRRKRVDLVAFGKNRLGFEVAMGDLQQELRNIREDLASGALDIVIVASPSASFLKKLHAHVQKDPVLRTQMARIKYRKLEEVEEDHE